MFVYAAISENFNVYDEFFLCPVVLPNFKFPTQIISTYIKSTHMPTYMYMRCGQSDRRTKKKIWDPSPGLRKYNASTTKFKGLWQL